MKIKNDLSKKNIDLLSSISLLKNLSKSDLLKEGVTKVSLLTFLKSKRISRFQRKNKDITFLLGKRYFGDLIFKIRKGVFIPQEDTFSLIDLVNEKKESKGIEIGIGSGLISVALSKIYQVNMTGIDINKKAISLSKKNASLNNVEINLVLRSMESFSKDEGKNDFLVSNPPYISRDENLDSIVKNTQPLNSLYAEDNGLYFYKYIIENFKNFIKPGGTLYFEIGYNQKESLELFLNTQRTIRSFNFEKDLFDNWRVMIIKTYN